MEANSQHAPNHFFFVSWWRNNPSFKFTHSDIPCSDPGGVCGSDPHLYTVSAKQMNTTNVSRSFWRRFCCPRMSANVLKHKDTAFKISIGPFTSLKHLWRRFQLFLKMIFFADPHPGCFCCQLSNIVLLDGEPSVQVLRALDRVSSYPTPTADWYWVGRWWNVVSSKHDASNLGRNF